MANGTIRKLLTVVISWASVGLIPLESFADSLMMTTWYPAPYGVYSQLRSTGNSYFAYQGGNVGIGTLNPTYKLYVAGRGLFTYAGPFALGVGNNNTGDPSYWLGGASNGVDLIFSSSGAQERMRLTDAGNLGIGTANPGFSGAKVEVVQTGAGVQNALNLASEIDGLGNGVAMNLVMGKPGINQEPEGKIAAVLVGPYGNASDSNLVFYARGGNVLNEGLRISNYGNVGIGTSNPQASLDVQQNSYGGAGLRVGGTCVSGYCLSDRALKTDIRYLSGSLAVVERLRPARFKYKDDSRKSEGYGLIAQDVEKVAPKFVRKGSNGYLQVDYSSIEMMLLDAVRELKQENDALKAKTEKLEGDIHSMKVKSEAAAAAVKP